MAKHIHTHFIKNTGKNKYNMRKREGHVLWKYYWSTWDT